ncbi:hypothetical protein GCM10027444_02950 [Actinopolyspora lacussalsi]
MTDSNTSHDSENRHDGLGLRGEHPLGDGRARWAGVAYLRRADREHGITTAHPTTSPTAAVPRSGGTCPDPHVGSVSTARTARHGAVVHLEPAHASGCRLGGGYPVPSVHSKQRTPIRDDT